MRLRSHRKSKPGPSTGWSSMPTILARTAPRFRMCGSIREFGFKIPVLARSDRPVVDGHLRLKAARKLGSWPGGDTTGIPVILCDKWSEVQVRAFRLLVNRSVEWAAWDDDPLALELQELNEADFDLSLICRSRMRPMPFPSSGAAMTIRAFFSTNRPRRPPSNPPR